LGRIGTFATASIPLTKRAHRSRTAILTCLLAAWPYFAAAQATAPAPGSAYGEAIAEAQGDPLQAWFGEQDKLLDDILLRLARIEILVSDIHRLISQLPNPIPTKTVPAPALVARSTIPQAPSTSAPIASASLAATVTGWAPQFAGGALLLLLLLWRARRRTPNAKIATATPTSAQERPKTAPAVAPPVAPVRISAPSMATTEPPGDQAIELAEIMLSMGLGHGAAQTLAEQIRHEPKQALRQWLKLLEIYRQNGQQSEFERSAEELRQHFNVQPEDWQARPESYRSIEEYPHIATRLTELWGKPSCLNYLGNLLDDNRGGARTGFPQTVAEELLLLTAMLRWEGIVAEAEAAVNAA
jgi:hypothetical protein